LSDGSLAHICRNASLPNANIKHSPKSFAAWTKKYYGWHLVLMAVDLDYDCEYIAACHKIKYCPYCGEELQEG